MSSFAGKWGVFVLVVAACVPWMVGTYFALVQYPKLVLGGEYVAILDGAWNTSVGATIVSAVMLAGLILLASRVQVRHSSSQRNRPRSFWRLAKWTLLLVASGAVLTLLPAIFVNIKIYRILGEDSLPQLDGDVSGAVMWLAMLAGLFGGALFLVDAYTWTPPVVVDRKLLS